MGGHGGLNILPQKRWNVYNYENREKVRKDEEAAAKEEQLKREQARKRDAEFRLEQLRAARGLAPLNKPGGSEAAAEEPEEVVESEPKSGHINLFEGIKIFDPIKVSRKEEGAEQDGFKRKKLKKEEVAPKVVAPEDEKYRLGYGVAGKGVKLPWYLEKRNVDVEEGSGNDRSERVHKDEGRKTGKKTIEELREERMKRERREKERERALLTERTKTKRTLKDTRFSRRGLVARVHHHRRGAETLFPWLHGIKYKHSLAIRGPGAPFEMTLRKPQFQVIVMTANMGCDECRKKVSRVLSKVTGLREYIVDLSNKQVIIKADFGIPWEVENGFSKTGTRQD
ncbi:hypothetical protein V6N13_076972 [Hibiscus sabdariffa]|uniref:CBF1-interacting co-repressor CIR N-terminal domain-containing protein n=1 Tax=Hibiscus sabdariffa TaxID=183260 RepID=A0ABR2CN44_9ROSI